MYQLGLIGFPIKHSLSPWIHERFLKNTQLAGSYSLIEIADERKFPEKMRQLKEKKIAGFNVTVPYKQTIIPYLDQLDDEAKEMGAVNTVVFHEGKWIGYNTDGKGYLRSLMNQFPELLKDQTKKILILGAGGAARGIYYALAHAGFNHVDIANRTKESAAEIAALQRDVTYTNVLTLTEAEEQAHEYDVLIQTTSVGMGAGNQDTIISLKQLKASAIVSDIIYQPIETTFLKQAKSLGASIHLGHTMLLYQAQYAFEIWTNHLAAMEHMDDELKQILEGR